MERRQIYVNGERVSGGVVPQDQLWMVIDRALRAEGEQPPAMPPAAASARGRPIPANNARGLSPRRFRDLFLNAWGFTKPRRRDQLASLIDF